MAFSRKAAMLAWAKNADGKLRGQDGRRLCRACAGPVPKGRRSFCGNGCVKEWQVRMWPQETRRALWDRDHGICQICGTDTVPAHLRALMGRARSDYHRRAFGCRADWDADHTVPLVEGGENSLENLRTLCKNCHRNETRKLAGRLAKARRDSRAQMDVGHQVGVDIRCMPGIGPAEVA